MIFKKKNYRRVHTFAADIGMIWYIIYSSRIIAANPLARKKNEIKWNYKKNQVAQHARLPPSPPPPHSKIGQRENSRWLPITRCIVLASAYRYMDQRPHRRRRRRTESHDVYLLTPLLLPNKGRYNSSVRTKWPINSARKYNT